MIGGGKWFSGMRAVPWPVLDRERESNGKFESASLDDPQYKCGRPGVTSWPRFQISLILR